MSPWTTCARCDGPLYPYLARVTGDGWVHADYIRVCRPRLKHVERDARLEDLRDLASWGVGATEAATRVGLSNAKVLERWCQRNGHHDLMRRLVANDPHDHNRSTAGRENDERAGTGRTYRRAS